MIHLKHETMGLTENATGGEGAPGGKSLPQSLAPQQSSALRCRG